jgi:Flp pilus assembly pilin Flp
MSGDPYASDTDSGQEEGGGNMLLKTYVRTTTWLRSLREERGAVSTEYALLLVLIALAIIGAATALGLKIAGVFDNASTSLGGL